MPQTGSLRSIGSKASCKSRDRGSIPGQKKRQLFTPGLPPLSSPIAANSYKVQFLFNRDVRKRKKCQLLDIKKGFTVLLDLH